VIILLIKSRTVLYNKIDMVVQRIPLLGITIFKVAVIFEFWLRMFGVFLCVCGCVRFVRVPAGFWVRDHNLQYLSVSE
jgi:hypothetical protein